MWFAGSKVNVQARAKQGLRFQIEAQFDVEYKCIHISM